MPRPRAVRELSMVLQALDQRAVLVLQESGQTEGELLGSKFSAGGSLGSGTVFLHFLWEHWRGQLLKTEHECPQSLTESFSRAGWEGLVTWYTVLSPCREDRIPQLVCSQSLVLFILGLLSSNSV